MAVRKAHAQWNGTLREGQGAMKLGSGAFEGAYSFASRFEDASGTNPEELIGAAAAGCFSMYLSMLLGKASHPPKSINTDAAVHLGDGPAITRIELDCAVDAPGLSDAVFQELAADAKRDCPVSKALAGTEITLRARLA